MKTSLAFSLVAGALAGAFLYLAGWLTACAALVTAVLGALALYAGGLPAALLLLGFAALGNLPGSGERRRACQVIANAAFPVLALFLDPAGFLGGLGAAAADTAATVFGSRARWAWRPDRGRVPAGTNAAISPLGSAATLATAVLFALLAPAFGASPLAVLAGVLAGALLDTLVGLALEERLAWWGNDLTNLVATATGTAVALLLSSG